MCQKRNSVNTYILGKAIRLDSCLRNMIGALNFIGVKTIMCCCGHGRYNPSIIVKTDNDLIIELFSGEILEEGRTYYKKDEEGFYYIPKTEKEVKD